LNPVSKDILNKLKSVNLVNQNLDPIRKGFYGQTTDWSPSINDYKKTLVVYENIFSIKERVQDKTIPGLRTDLIQIRVIDTDYDQGYSDAFEVERYLDELGPFNIDYGDYICYYKTILSEGDPFLLEKDSNDRYVFVCNFETKREVIPK
jgi:hypothetical protein